MERDFVETDGDEDDVGMWEMGVLADSCGGTASTRREGRPPPRGWKQMVLQPMGERTGGPTQGSSPDTPPTERRVVEMAAPSPSLNTNEARALRGAAAADLWGAGPVGVGQRG